MNAAALILGVPTALDLCYLATRMRDDERLQFAALTGITRDIAENAGRTYVAARGPLFALYDDTGAVMAGGFEPVRPGVFEAWAVGTPEAWRRHWREISLCCGRLVRRMLREQAHRIQLLAIPSRTAAHEWYERVLGLASEGIQKAAASDGGDLVMFARVRT